MKSKRDYLRKGSHFSWLYLSRLAALKEYAFMKALGDHGLPVPKVGRACSWFEGFAALKLLASIVLPGNRYRQAPEHDQCLLPESGRCSACMVATCPAVRCSLSLTRCVQPLPLLVVQAIDHNRHAVLMTLLDAYPLVQVG